MSSKIEPTLSEKIERTIKAFGVTARVLADELRTSEEWISRIRRGKEPGSDDLRLRLDEYLRRKGLEPTSFFTPDSLQVGEPADVTILSGSEKKSETRRGVVSPIVRSAIGDRPSGRMLSTPQYSDAGAQPSEQQVTDYFLRYIAKARQTPGGLGHVWFALHEHFKFEKLDAVTEPQEKKT